MSFIRRLVRWYWVIFCRGNCFCFFHSWTSFGRCVIPSRLIEKLNYRLDYTHLLKRNMGSTILCQTVYNIFTQEISFSLNPVFSIPFKHILSFSISLEPLHVHKKLGKSSILDMIKTKGVYLFQEHIQQRHI